ncbi:hypothetical protein AMAG_19130 [Allomyces macrogynus ATCC 38327]|uniref:Uncharacterized protein n=1 Tax=Allomyces macrogynus (strain ATCC 38327) TaxID=578462 RepID=A0A0L0SNW7_ALLM3|nr:hypothetical protein AMAG_19130 [Allomyces macrogynus ATCC 38327]|eukprot:KNE64213.1 hypothetical protein AMAG_19130 [Allomyces macrogynus ATCC 38327]
MTDAFAMLSIPSPAMVPGPDGLPQRTPSYYAAAAQPAQAQPPVAVPLDIPMDEADDAEFHALHHLESFSLDRDASTAMHVDPADGGAVPLPAPTAPVAPATCLVARHARAAAASVPTTSTMPATAGNVSSLASAPPPMYLSLERVLELGGASTVASIGRDTLV